MKRSVMLVLALCAIALTASGWTFAAEADIDGARPGKWTMDLDAAKKIAAEKNLPILVNFSGSDWCGWCNLMEESVFSQDAWKTYSSNGILMVIIDFPKDKSLVPEKYVTRNEELRERLAVEGFPTFVLLDSDGKTELGRLGAGRDTSPEMFISEIKALLIFTPAEVEKYVSGLNDDGKTRYKAIVNRILSTRERLTAARTRIEEIENEINRLEESGSELESQAKDFRAEQLGAEEFEEYKAMKAKLEAAAKELTDWIASGPDRSEENMKKFQTMNETIQYLTARLAKY